MWDKLENLAQALRRRFGASIQWRACVDTSAIVERELAAAAGIGWIGKNTMALNAAIGSYFYLGELLTDLPIASDPPQPDHCGTCTRCLEACPTGAFPRPYEMDASRCISYLTIEHRGDIDGELARQMEDWVFGCDVCQQVCPFNRAPPTGLEPQLAGTADDAYPLLNDIESWNEEAYRLATHDRAQSRAKLAMWRRNAKIAAANLGPED
jgi:epoxyqueuosine reductase